MPLFVLNEDTEYLDIDAIALPYFKGIDRFYKTNTFYNKKLYNLLDIFTDEEKIKIITDQEKFLKNKLEKLIKIKESNELEKRYSKKINKLIWDNNFAIHSLLNNNDADVFSEIINEYPSIKKIIEIPKDQIFENIVLLEEYYEKEEILNESKRNIEEKLDKISEKILAINKLDKKYVITFNIDIKEHLAFPDRSKYSILSEIYENIIKLALKKKNNKIAIPIIDLCDMADPNYYIDLARIKVRDLLEKEEKDITVYLLLINKNNDYFKDRPLENIYEKISFLKNEDDATKAEIEKQAKKRFKEYKKYLNNKSEYNNLLKLKKDFLNSSKDYSGFKDLSRKLRNDFDSFDIKKEKHYSDKDYLYFYYDYLLYDINHNNINEKEKENENESRVEKAKSAPNVKRLKYFDEKAFWENIRRCKNTEFEIDYDDIIESQINNKKILKKLGEDLKSCLEEKELKEKSNIRRKRVSSESENLQKEIQSLIEAKKESFSQMVLRIIKKTHRDNVACYKAANVNKNIFSKILKDAKGDENKDGTAYVYSPDKKIVLAFAIALRLKFKEAEELLQKAGYAFSDSSIDIIVKTFIKKGIYDIDLVNQFLFRFKQPLLGSTARE